MRKVIFQLIILLSAKVVNGQRIILKNDWIGENLQYVYFYDTTLLLDYGYGLRKYQFIIEQTNIKICEYEWNSIDGLKKDNHIIFEIKKYSEDTLILYPLNEKANNLFDSKQIKFTAFKKIKDSNFIFQKLIFSSTTCYGKCRDLTLEIDSNRNIIFWGRRYTGRYIGFYEGKVSKKHFNKIIESLKYSAINRLPKNLGGAIDAPEYEFIYYYNNKRVESKGYFVPYVHRPVLFNLLNCYKKSKLKKLEKVYLFETIKITPNRSF